MTARHRRPEGVLRSSVSELADLVLQRSCAGCGSAGTSWCAECAARLACPPTVRPVVAAGARVPGGPGLRVWSVAEFRDEVRAAIVSWKDRGRADLTGVLAQGLRRSVLAAVADVGVRPAVADDAAPRPLLLVPAPSSRRSRRDRGHEPVRDLAVRCAQGLRRRGVEVLVVPALVHGRLLSDQAGLGRTARAENLAGALRVAPGWRSTVRGRDCVLVDDVVTSGATLLECARALAGLGARVLAAATVASTPRQDRDP